MTEGTFSIQVVLRDLPDVVVGLNKDGIWLDLVTFNKDRDGLSGITVHLPKDPQAIKEFAAQLVEAAAKVEAAQMVGAK